MAEMNRPSLARPFNPDAGLSAMGEVRTPRRTRGFAKFLLLMFLATPFVLAFVPWQQTVQGRGRVIAFDPARRQQAVTARVSGQIAKWYVKETDTVKAGQKIVDIVDTDPALGERLEAQHDFLQEQLQQAQQQVKERRAIVRAQTEARDAAISAAEAKRRAAERGVESTRAALTGAEALVTFEELRYGRLTKLLESKLGGLESELNVADSRYKLRRAEADVAKLKEDLSKAQADVKQAEADVKKASADGSSAVATAVTALQQAEQGLLDIKGKLQDVENKIQRYSARFITAPVDGTVFRVMPEASQIGQYVKEGQTLASIVPDTTERVVELYIDGVDAPLIVRDVETGEYPQVRIQFEGWPVVQFSGWPSASLGTFGGRVFRIDPTDNQQGKFRVLIKPEPYFEDDDWPDQEFLRQGNQAVGWIFLRRVSLGYELWRRMNGFPPVNPPLKADELTTDEGKPPKIKVP